jgi:hypothetical protein
MTQYDAGPGDWSDRPWEDPEKKPQPHARRRKVSLPPWALLAILAAIIIVLCVGLVLIVGALRDGDNGEATPPQPTATPTARQTAVIPRPTTPTAVTSPTATVVLPIEGTAEPTPITEIGPGATVVVKGTGGTGLNLREQPTTYARVVESYDEGAELTVLDGPREADGYVWWQLRAADGKEGWGAANWLALKTEE